jgi:hypothetical protein
MGARTTKDAMTKPSCRFPRPRTVEVNPQINSAPR